MNLYVGVTGRWCTLSVLFRRREENSVFSLTSRRIRFSGQLYYKLMNDTQSLAVHGSWESLRTSQEGTSGNKNSWLRLCALYVLRI